MVQAFSLTSDSLGYFIGYTLYHAQRVAIVTPWLSNVQLRFPLNDQLDFRNVRLLDALEQLDETDVTLIVREGEEHNDFVRDRLPEGTSFLAVDDLHAKVVVCDEFVYLGSANITRGGLGINREVCEIVENEYQDTAEYLERELDIGYPAES